MKEGSSLRSSAGNQIFSSRQLGLAVGTSENRQSVVQSCRPRKTASTLCPVDFVADRGGCNGDSPRVGGFGTASATPLIERSAAPSPSTATELSPQICSWGLEKTPSLASPGQQAPLAQGLLRYSWPARAKPGT